MTVHRNVKLFRNGRNQAVRIPREFELPGTEAVMRKEGERLIIEPRKKTAAALLDLVSSWETLDEEIGPIEDLPLRKVRL